MTKTKIPAHSCNMNAVEAGGNWGWDGSGGEDRSVYIVIYQCTLCGRTWEVEEA